MLASASCAAAAAAASAAAPLSRSRPVLRAASELAAAAVRSSATNVGAGSIIANRRCFSSILRRPVASIPPGARVPSWRGGGVSIGQERLRLRAALSTTTAPEEALAPESITPEIALAVQDATMLFVRHGLGKRKLERIAAEKAQGPSTLVSRWQQMMEAYLQIQCHVLSGMGYSPDERGITLYNTHLGETMARADSARRNELRIAGRDSWREVLRSAFALPDQDDDEITIVDARNVMHKVSSKMQEPAILEKVAQLCAGSVAVDPKNEDAVLMDVTRKHTVVQEVMVHDVYLGGLEGKADGSSQKSLVSECGFGEGEDAYVRMQMAMAEHQTDPLVQQYVGAAMVRLLQSAGIDMRNVAGGSVSK